MLIYIYICVFVPKHALTANVHAPRHASAVVEPYRHCISPQCATFNSQQVEDDGFASDFADGGTPQNSKALWRLLHWGGQGYKSLDQIFYPQKDWIRSNVRVLVLCHTVLQNHRKYMKNHKYLYSLPWSCGFMYLDPDSILSWNLGIGGFNDK